MPEATAATALSLPKANEPSVWESDPGLLLPLNSDPITIGRFYGYTLENPGKGALRQLDSYLATGHMLSADKSIDYHLRRGAI